MKDFFYAFMKLLSLIVGVAFGAGGGYLCYINNQFWGWFLFVGFLIVVGTIIWSAISEGESK